MVAPTPSLRDLPDLITYLKLVKAQLSSEPETLRQVLDNVEQWIRKSSSADHVFYIECILRLTSLLRHRPRLVYGLNALIRIGPHYRLECLTTTENVKYFVLVPGALAVGEILSTGDRIAPFPSTTLQLREVITSQGDWERLVPSNSEPQWRACIAQLLQELLDHPETDRRYRRQAIKCLDKLARDAIVPPSSFINFVLAKGEQPAVHAADANYMACGGFTDIHMKVVKGIPTCFRVIRMSQTSETVDLYKDFCWEVTLWRQLKHPNIMPFTGASLELFPNRYCFVLPWQAHGPITSFLRKNPNHDRFTSICEIVDAIDYLHGLDPPVIHKDIKGANILVGDNLVCLLSDFGFSSVVDSQRLRSESVKGSINWSAPEVMDPRLATGADPSAVDIYSLACTIYEIYTGHPPFSSAHPAAVICSVMRNERPDLPPLGSWTEEEIDMWRVIVEPCWQAAPGRRPTIKVIKDALQEIRPSTPKRQASPMTGTPSDVDLTPVRRWLDQELHPPRVQAAAANPRQLSIHVPIPKVPVTHRSKGLFTPNTPTFSSLPEMTPSNTPTPHMLKTHSSRPVHRQPLPTPEPSPSPRSPIIERGNTDDPKYQLHSSSTTQILIKPLRWNEERRRIRRIPLGSRPITGPAKAIPPHIHPGRAEGLRGTTPSYNVSSPLRQAVTVQSHRDCSHSDDPSSKRDQRSS